MKRVKVKEIFKKKEEYLGKEVTVAGWIRQIRDSKKIVFIELNDGSFFKPIQIIVEEEDVDNFEEIAKLNISASIIVKGILEETPNSKQPFEIKSTHIW